MANDFSIKDMYASYVNLSHRTDRLAHMKQQLERIGLKAERFEAIRTVDDSWNRPPYQKMFNRTRGAIGCMLSQMAVMQKAYDMGKGAIVLEDDLVFASDTMERLDYIENFVNTKEPDADIIFLGGTVHCSPSWWHKIGHNEMLAPYCNCTLGRDMERIGDKHMVRVYGMFSTHAYIVPYRKIPEILDFLNTTMHQTIGIDFSLIMLQPKLKCFAFLPGTVKQYNAVSDIGNGITYFENFSKLNGSLENSRYWWADKLSDVSLDGFDWAEANIDWADKNWKNHPVYKELQEIVKEQTGNGNKI